MVSHKGSIMFSRLAIPAVAKLVIGALASWIIVALAQARESTTVSPQVPALKAPADVTLSAKDVVMHPDIEAAKTLYDAM